MKETELVEVFTRTEVRGTQEQEEDQSFNFFATESDVLRGGSPVIRILVGPFRDRIERSSVPVRDLCSALAT